MTIHEATFDATDVNELAQRFTLPELRRMLEKAKIDAHTDAFFKDTPYADSKAFPNADFAEVVSLAIDAKRAATPKPTYQGNGHKLDVERARAADIVVVAEKYTTLRKSGSRHIGRCPIHQDKTPSFVCFPNNTFHCFGCQKGGDVIALLMAVEGIDFKTAVERLGG